MNRLLLAGMAFSLTAITAVDPAFANPPNLELQPGNGGTQGVFVNPGPGRGGAPAGGGGGQRGPVGAPAGGGPRFGAPAGGGQRFGGPGGGGQRFGGPGEGGQRFGGPGGGQQHFGGYRRHNGFGGAAIGAGVAGLAAGALIGGALANQQPAYSYDPGYGSNGYYAPAQVYADPGSSYAEEESIDNDGPGDVAYCQRRYRSYDVRSGTYLGLDGDRHACP